jgi:soluble lytic murein transglycosylase
LRSSSDFYEGLKKKQTEAKIEASACFEKALDNPNIHVAAAAAAELMSLHYSGVEIRAQTISKIREKAPAMTASKASGSWAMTLDALGTGREGDPGPNREKILSLTLNNGNRSPDEAIQYLLRELRAANVFAGFDGGANEVGTAAANNSMFSNAENAAIAGRIAVSHSRYREALIFFRMVMEDSPDLFFQYPELLSDLGRCFQYATTAPSAAGREGIDLFLQWEKNLGEKKINEDENLNALIRFRLLFYAARIARQNGFTESIELFERALPWALALAPDIRGGASERGEQIDACIWYILNISLAKDLGRTIKYLETYIIHWYDDSYYSDVMDKLARELLLKRRWTDIINIFALVKNRPGVIGAKFAWITGRAIQSGLLSSREMEQARTALGIHLHSGVPDESKNIAQIYIHIAYNNTAPLGALPSGVPIFDVKSLYYRSLSAAALDEPFFVADFPAPLPSVKTPAADPGESEAMQFLLGFFRNSTAPNGAAKHASRYIRMMESDLSIDELRLLAEALGNDGQYQESMRLVSSYTRQDSYKYQRKDLELLYPRPFIDYVNQYAQETGLAPAKLYGLIRTESAFNSDAISRSGAIGLTQLMPATAEEMAARILRRGGPDYTRRPDKDGGRPLDGLDEISGDTESADRNGLIANEVGIDLLNPGANIHMGAVYLAYLEDRMEDPLLSLLAYNGGMTRVRRWRNSMPVMFSPDIFLETVEYAETMDYGRAVMGAAAMYRELYE